MLMVMVEIQIAFFFFFNAAKGRLVLKYRIKSLQMKQIFIAEIRVRIGWGTVQFSVALDPGDGTSSCNIRLLS